MDHDLIDHLMHTFCHVKDGRRFCYETEAAWLCHRCSGIYSSFFIFAILAKITHWRGNWTAKGSSLQVYGSAGFLLAICGLQVFIQQFDGDSGGGAWARFVVGSGVGLALLQVALFHGTPAPSPRKVNPLFFVWTILPLGALHLWLQSESYVYHLATGLPGLLLMYAWINVLAIGPWLKNTPPWKKCCVIVLAIVLEWLFLYYMNVGRYLV